MQQLIALEGTVDCRVFAAAVGLSLQGREAPMVQVLFSGVAQMTPQPPASLHAVRVTEIEPAAASLTPPAPKSAAPPLRRFCIEAAEGRFEVLARGLQCHRDARDAFFAAVPARPAPLMLRWGWSLLLSLLRLGPFRRLLSRQ